MITAQTQTGLLLYGSHKASNVVVLLYHKKTIYLCKLVYLKSKSQRHYVNVS